MQLVAPRAVRIAEAIEAISCTINFAVSFLVMAYLLPLVVRAEFWVVRIVAAAAGIATLVAALRRTASALRAAAVAALILVLILLLRILNLAAGAGNSLNLLAGAVDAGNLDGGVGQLVLQVD